MEAADLQNEVMQFVALKLHVPIERLRLSTRIQQDLGGNGHLGWCLMQDFWIHFGIDREEYRDDLHFWNWGCNPAVYLFLMFFHSSSLKLIPITIGDLIEAAQSKRWHTPKREPI